MREMSPQDLLMFLGIGLSAFAYFYRVNIINRAKRFRQQMAEANRAEGHKPDIRTGSPNLGDYLLFWATLIGGMVFLGASLL